MLSYGPAFALRRDQVERTNSTKEVCERKAVVKPGYNYLVGYKSILKSGKEQNSK
jgi:hypothetical protein